ncbi:conserved phage C-terminal domain-containing protein [Citrifermentans bremense]|uniref:conserved phage C-terminal domain-containing protein n=1 Tax=Citrifermentans bremense TaxID=60035 RepID=UPI000479E277|nr:conserved phage C-terminal domain-containing protein [Citrifermentans bremense]
MHWRELIGRDIDGHWQMGREIVKFCGDYHTASLLSQLLYWRGKTKNKAGWLYKTDEEWLDELFLSRAKLVKARNKLREMGVLETKTGGNRNKTHYLLKIDALKDLFPLADTDNNNAVRLIVNYLNHLTGYNFEVSDSSTYNKINQRVISHGITACINVVFHMHCEWSSSTMERNLRPSTLFGTKFTEYLSISDYIKKEADTTALILDEIMTIENDFNFYEYGISIITGENFVDIATDNEVDPDIPHPTHQDKSISSYDYCSGEFLDDDFIIGP